MYDFFFCVIHYYNLPHQLFEFQNVKNVNNRVIFVILTVVVVFVHTWPKVLPVVDVSKVPIIFKPLMVVRFVYKYWNFMGNMIFRITFASHIRIYFNYKFSAENTYAKN